MWYQYFDLVKAIEKDSDNEFNFITIQNLMRRILETYFKFIGNVRYTELLKNIKKSKPQEDFTGLDSMVIWLNQGSHGVAIESYCVPKDSEEVKYFIEQFKKLFKYLGHEQHYQMMEESNNKISEMK